MVFIAAVPQMSNRSLLESTRKFASAMICGEAGEDYYEPSRTFNTDQLPTIRIDT